MKHMRAMKLWQEGERDAESGNLAGAVRFWCEGFDHDSRVIQEPQHVDRVANEVRRADPHGYYATCLCAFMATGRQDTNAAPTMLDECISRGVPAAVVFYCRGNTRCWANQFQEAVEDFTRAIELDPSNIHLRAARGQAAQRGFGDDRDCREMAYQDFVAFSNAVERQDPYDDGLALVYYDLVALECLKSPSSSKMGVWWEKTQAAEKRRLNNFGPCAADSKVIAEQMMLAITTRTCHNCHQPGSEKLSKCSGCLSAAYCSRKCQNAHWKREHKSQCAAYQRGPSAGVNEKSPSPRPIGLSASEPTASCRFR